MGCTDSAGESRWYLPRCSAEGCNWDVNHEGDFCWVHRQLAAVAGTDRLPERDPEDVLSWDEQMDLEAVIASSGPDDFVDAPRPDRPGQP